MSDDPGDHMLAVLKAMRDKLVDRQKNLMDSTEEAMADCKPAEVIRFMTRLDELTWVMETLGEAAQKYRLEVLTDMSTDDMLHTTNPNQRDDENE